MLSIMEKQILNEETPSEIMTSEQELIETHFSFQNFQLVIVFHIFVTLDQCLCI